MGTPFMAEIRMVSFNFPPKGWALCNGQLLPINQNQALFSLLGTTYGGNGQTNFALPDLRGRVPVSDLGGLGGHGGEEAHTLTQAESGHWHGANASSQPADETQPAGNVWAVASAAAYGSGQACSMDVGVTTSNVGGNQPHSNMQPYAVVNFAIALQGIFPSQN